MSVDGIVGHNMAGVDARVPLGCLTAITGVSGAGKSTLLQALGDAVRDRLHQEDADEGDEPAESVPVWDLEAGSVSYAAASGLGAVDRLVVVDQSPIGRTSRSNLATYTGLFAVVRRLFAAQPLARERGYTAGRFSFNQPQGRCPHCLGDGEVSIELLFMPTETVACPVCGGARYNPETLEVRYGGRSVADLLAMSVDEALEFLSDLPTAARILDLLSGIGLGYLSLGQSATTLSGGEAQRIKLVRELHRAPVGHSLYLLDEPTNGLHPADIDLLVGRLQGLVDADNSVVMADHDLRTIAVADWVIDVGPGAGDEGGRIVAVGRPDEVAADPASLTGRHLRGAMRR
ncbi:hypothetical protein [Tessaracoccus aquimaris]|uniref:hypothetical protein n=1 Tax=Tessaracoccus aquimaris TaxID=1332264 RepID=UPI001D0519A5|nr:hypothetical protein [Tessaracoccus aquimaris]